MKHNVYNNETGKYTSPLVGFIIAENTGYALHVLDGSLKYISDYWFPVEEDAVFQAFYGYEFPRSAWIQADGLDEYDESLNYIRKFVLRDE